MLIISGTIATSYVVRNLAICGRNSAIDLAPFASWDVTLSVTRVTIKMEIWKYHQNDQRMKWKLLERDFVTEGFIVDLARTEVEVLRKLQVVMFFGVLPPFIRPVVGQIEILGHSIPKISANAAKKKLRIWLAAKYLALVFARQQNFKRFRFSAMLTGQRRMDLLCKWCLKVLKGRSLHWLRNFKIFAVLIHHV